MSSNSSPPSSNQRRTWTGISIASPPLQYFSFSFSHAASEVDPRVRKIFENMTPEQREALISAVNERSSRYFQQAPDNITIHATWNEEFKI